MFGRRIQFGDQFVPDPSMVVHGWVNFSGVTPTVNGHHNVSSVTKNATGRFTVTWQVPLASAFYALGGAAKDASTNITIVTQDKNTAAEPCTATSASVMTRVSNAETLTSSDVITVLTIGP